MELTWSTLRVQRGFWLAVQSVRLGMSSLWMTYSGWERGVSYWIIAVCVCVCVCVWVGGMDLPTVVDSGQSTNHCGQWAWYKGSALVVVLFVRRFSAWQVVIQKCTMALILLISSPRWLDTTPVVDMPSHTPVSWGWSCQTDQLFPLQPFGSNTVHTWAWLLWTWVLSSPCVCVCVCVVAVCMHV